MPKSKNSFEIRSKVYLYPGMAGWHFVGIPKEPSAEIKKRFGANARGWGSLPVEVTLGKTVWKTSIFPDKKSGTYLLPLKAKVRQQEDIEPDDIVTFKLSFSPIHQKP